MLQSMRIEGGHRLEGTVEISGAKNLALPAMVASLLTDQPIVLHNVPNLTDITTMLGILEHLGSDPSCYGSDISLCTKNIVNVEAPYDYVRKMRASILCLSPLVSRCGRARVSLPGGCAIGLRSVDLHIRTLVLMGADISIEDGFIKASAPNGLTGCEIEFPKVTVTGTENALMASVLAKGSTRLVNVAIEPEVQEFAKLLNLMGAKISGIGTSVLEIEGVEKLHGAEFNIIPDRIEAGTYAIASSLTHGKIFLKNCIYGHLQCFFTALQQTGTTVQNREDGVLVYNNNDVIYPYCIYTDPYPAFPTDLQAQYMVLMSLCNGNATVTENLFENRFMHVQELIRMGANIYVDGRCARITGVQSLKGAPVMATDLRASVALVLAGLIAEGTTIVNRLYHIDRGYDNIDNKLCACGAVLERITQ